MTPHVAYIQERDAAFYKQFQVVIGGLDNLTARRWLNSTLAALAGEAGAAVPYIDGGTEGFKGQVQIILHPGITACFECTIDNFPPRAWMGGALARAAAAAAAATAHSHGSRHPPPPLRSHVLPDLHHRRDAAPARALHRLRHAHPLGARAPRTQTR